MLTPVRLEIARTISLSSPIEFPSHPSATPEAETGQLHSKRPSRSRLPVRCSASDSHRRVLLLPPRFRKRRRRALFFYFRLKRWERKECKPNSLHILHKMHAKLGDTVKVEAPVHSLNVMLYPKDKEVASRVGHKILDDGRWVRYLVQTGEIIDITENWKKLKESKGKTEVAATS